MKREYMKPTTLVIELRHKAGLLLQTSVNSMSTNLNEGDAIDYGGGSNGPARARSYGGINWDDWE